jgi:hypothetical protein
MAAVERQADSVREFFSQHAGVFLLLPSYDAAGCDEELPEEGRAWFRASVLAACLGVSSIETTAIDATANINTAVDDPAVALASGWRPPVEDPPPSPLSWSEARDRLAQRTLRRFAKGLIGFADSSAEYLGENLLSGGGAVRCADDSIEVVLPAVPLQLVLRIAGWHRREYSTPWLAPRMVRVCLEGD